MAAEMAAAAKNNQRGGGISVVISNGNGENVNQ